MSGMKKIVLIPRTVQYDEFVASGIFKPGHLLIRDSDNKVKKHDVAGGFAEMYFATEDSLQGRTIADAYAVGERARVWRGTRGDLFQGRIPAAAAAIAIGDKLVSDGGGCLVKQNALAAKLLYESLAASTAITNADTSEHDFDVTYTIPANSLKAGDILTIRGMAVVSAAAGTDTLTFKVYLGSTAILVSAAVNSTTGDIVSFQATLVVRTVGASGTFVGSGGIYNGASAVGTAVVGGAGSTAIDTTATKVVKASATWSATTATCSIALQALIVEVERADAGTVLAVANEAVDNSAGGSEALIEALIA